MPRERRPGGRLKKEGEVKEPSIRLKQNRKRNFKSSHISKALKLKEARCIFKADKRSAAGEFSCGSVVNQSGGLNFWIQLFYFI